jgi:hypothetical protein
MRRTAGFHPHKATRKVPEKGRDVGATNLSPNNRPAIFIDAVNLKNCFGKIETYCNNRHVDGPPECGVSATTTLWHFDAGGQRSSTPSIG